MALILGALEPYQSDLVGVVVESTYNWYWLVDGLMAANYQVHLANTTAIEQYSGLKHSDDESDAQWLAELLRLGILPEGYIYPKEERAVRDLLRKRSHLVRQHTANVQSVQNLMSRNLGHGLTANQVRRLTHEAVVQLLPDTAQALAVQSTLLVLHGLEGAIELIEREVRARMRLRPEYQALLTVPGIGEILGLTIVLETGTSNRFAKVGRYASYCRCVDSHRLSNGKTKGHGNTKNGNRYLAWAYVEAANFAVRYSEPIKRYYQRKRARTNGVVAIKTVAHKLARACYYILRDRVPFDVHKAFA
jgi:transposase